MGASGVQSDLVQYLLIFYGGKASIFLLAIDLMLIKFKGKILDY
jgi:hypothetical protein